MSQYKVMLIGVICFMAWAIGVMVNVMEPAGISVGVTSNPIIVTLGVFTLSLFLFGYGAPLAMLLVGLSNGTTFAFNWKATMICAVAAWMSAYASIRLGTSLMDDMRGRGSMSNAARSSSIILCVAILISLSLDIFPELGIPALGTEIAPETAKTAVVFALRDTYLDASEPSENFGTSDKLGFGGLDGEKWALLGFAVPDRMIASASLRVYVRDFRSFTAEGVEIYASEAYFPEYGADWKTRPELYGKAADAVMPAQFGTMDITLTGMERFAGKEVMLVVKPAGTGAAWMKAIGSRESLLDEMRPRLIVKYFE